MDLQHKALHEWQQVLWVLGMKYSQGRDGGKGLQEPCASLLLGQDLSWPVGLEARVPPLSAGK